MGVEFALVGIPLAKITPDRLAVLHGIIDGLTEEDWSDFRCEESDLSFDDFEEWVQALREAVNLLPDVEETRWREVNHGTYDRRLFEAMPFDVLFAGGLCCGGLDPSSTFTQFALIHACEQIVEQLMVWARADKEAAGW